MQQMDRQRNTPDYSGKRPLDTSAFEQATLTDSQRDALHKQINGVTIPQLRAMIADSRLNAVDLVTYYVDRIRRYDVGGYNSVLELNPDALQIARERDAQRDNGDSQGALHGIPVLLKDNIGTGDKLHNTAGAAALADHHCDRDSALAAKLRAAGAIILGKTNLSEWANWMTWDSSNGFSTLGGQTRNAYGDFDVGGSSSGSGAAAALNFAAATVGTETSGSLVSPASQNSLCTIKPSLGLISRDRIIPITDKQDTAGPMTRTMTDLAHMLTVMAGVDDNDPQTHKAAALDGLNFADYLDAAALKGVRVGLVKRDISEHAEWIPVRDHAVAALREAGAEVVDIEPLEIEFTLLTYFYGYKRGMTDYLQATGSDLTVEEIVAFNAVDPANRAPWGMGILEASAIMPLNHATAKAYERLHHTNQANAKYAVRRALREHDVAVLADINNWSTMAWAMSGFPAVTVPLGYRDDGQPIAITVFGDWLQDPQMIAYGYAIEQATNLRRDPVPVLPPAR